MTLKEFFATQPRGAKAQLCRDVGITKAWLSLLLRGNRKPSKHLAIVLSLWTDNKVTIDELINQEYCFTEHGQGVQPEKRLHQPPAEFNLHMMANL